MSHWRCDGAGSGIGRLRPLLGRRIVPIQHVMRLLLASHPPRYVCLLRRNAANRIQLPPQPRRIQVLLHLVLRKLLRLAIPHLKTSPCGVHLLLPHLKHDFQLH